MRACQASGPSTVGVTEPLAGSVGSVVEVGPLGAPGSAAIVVEVEVPGGVAGPSVVVVVSSGLVVLVVGRPGRVVEVVVTGGKSARSVVVVVVAAAKAATNSSYNSRVI